MSSCNSIASLSENVVIPSWLMKEVSSICSTDFVKSRFPLGEKISLIEYLIFCLVRDVSEIEESMD